MFKLKWFRRKKDDKALANNAEQELSTIKKLAMLERAKRVLGELRVERRAEIMPVEFERRRV